MTTLGWHADATLLDRYVRGDLGHPTAASLEQHLLACASCRAALRAQVDPAPLAQVWDGVVEQVQTTRPGLFERLLRTLRISAVDALLVAAAPAIRGAWLAGTLLTLVFATLAAAQDRGALLFLMVAPLVPVAGVAMSYGPDVDPCHEITVAASYSGVRLVLLRTAVVLATSLPVAAVGGLLLPGPDWTAVAWLLPAFAAVAVTLAASTWISVSRAAVVVGVAWFTVTASSAGPGFTTPTAAIAAPLLPVYAALALAGALVLWQRADRLNVMGRTS